jgi:hypothetical protein
MEPKYMVFFNGIDVAIKAPNGFALDNTHQLFLGSKSAPSLLPTVYVDTLQTLSTTLRGFGASSDDPVGFVPRVAPAAEVANNVSAASFTCAEHVQIAQQAMDDFIATGTYDGAVRAMFAAGSCLNREECTDVDEWVATATQIACDSLSNAILATGSITAYGQFRQVVSPLIYWASIARALDPSCSSLSQVATSLSTSINSFLTDFFTDELNALAKDDYVAFGALKDEARDAHKLFTEALFLGENATATSLQDNLVYPALSSMRDRAYELCQSDTWHYPLSRLTSVGFYSDRDEVGITPPNNPLLTESSLYGPFTDQNIWDDIQLCATQMGVTTKVLSGGQLDTESGAGGSSPGSAVTSVDIRTPSRGTLVLDGGIGALTCWDDVQADNQVTFHIGGVTVGTWNRAGDEYPTPLDLDIRSLGDFEDGTRVTMNVRRVRTACDNRLWGARDYEFLKINMDIEGPEGFTITHTLPDTVRAGDVVNFEVRVEIIDQLGLGSFDRGVDVSLSTVADVTLVPTAGQTDTNGVFNSRLEIPEDPVLAPGNKALGPANALLLISITANADGVDTTEVVQSVLKTCVVPGALVANSQEQLDTFDGVCQVKGTLHLGDDGSGTKINNLSALSELVFVEAIVIDDTDLTNLDGLEKLEPNSTCSIGIVNNASLTNIDSLGSAGNMTVESFITLQIKNNASLTSVAGLGNLIRPAGAFAFYVEVEGNNSLTSLSGLDNVRTAENLLRVTDNDALTSLSGLAPRDVGVLTIDGNALLESLFDSSVTAVNDSLAVRDNPLLTNLDGLGAVRSLTDGCEISGNAELSDIMGLQSLTTVGGWFIIKKNPKLCSLPAWVSGVTVPPGQTDFTENGTDPSCSPPAN